ncbi:MAG: hypothetical protein HYU66_00190, partial [Armatimonadetes bacterium]|nr:hypothetical protein [Armatimonadota bacterium]
SPGAPAAATAHDAPRSVLLHRLQSGEWALVAGHGARVWLNGVPVSLGLQVLEDRDEVRLETGGPAAWFAYFSTEQPATVRPYQPTGRAARCPRCKQAIGDGHPAVQCPKCGVWHHQTEARPCWNYAPKCATCDQATPLDGGFRWTPEELG